MTDRKNLE